MRVTEPGFVALHRARERRLILISLRGHIAETSAPDSGPVTDTDRSAKAAYVWAVNAAIEAGREDRVCEIVGELAETERPVVTGCAMV